VLDSVFAKTLLNPLASQRIPCTQALLCINTLVYFHLTAQYWYHTEATIKYKWYYLPAIPQQKDVLGRFRGRKSRKNVLEAMKKQLTLDKQEEWERAPAWNNLSAHAKCR
jgi:hypothetical protein